MGLIFVGDVHTLAPLGLAKLLFVRLSVSHVEVDLGLRDLFGLAPNHTLDALKHIEVVTQIFGDVLLQHQLVILSLEVLEHLLESPSMDRYVRLPYVALAVDFLSL